MANKEREQLWQERVAQWQASGLSQRAYVMEQGFPVRQVGYCELGEIVMSAEQGDFTEAEGLGRARRIISVGDSRIASASAARDQVNLSGLPRHA